jgi:hypothetical protein
MTPYDNAVPVSPPRGEPGSPAPYPIYKRSGSQKRRRKYSVQVALDEDDLARVKQSAQLVGLSLSSYGRAAMLGSPGPRAQRTPHVNAGLLARAIAALNKIGSLLNQIARVLNAGGAVALAGECYAALAEIREAARAIREAVGRKDRDDSQRKQA